MDKYEYNVKQSKILHDYIGQDKKVKINGYNLETLGEINEALDNYKLVSTKFFLVSSLLKKINFNLASQWIRICSSLRNQKELFFACKMKLKECGITKEQRNAILYSIKLFTERCIRIENDILPEYFNLTPLMEYEEKLMAKGQTLNDFLNSHLDNKGKRFEDEELNNITDAIMDEVGNDTRYLNRLNDYMNMINAKVDKYKSEKKSENLKKNINAAQDRLTYLANGVHKNIICNLSKFANFDFDKVHQYKVNGEKYVKIIIACKVYHGSSKGALYYVNKSEELSTSLSNSLVLAEKDPIPDKIQKMVDENKIVITEILFPA